MQHLAQLLKTLTLIPPIPKDLEVEEEITSKEVVKTLLAMVEKRIPSDKVKPSTFTLNGGKY